MNCGSCGAKLKGTETFCPCCGAEQRSMSVLVSLAAQGDEQAISELYGRTCNAVYASIKAKARVDEDTVLDVIQDAYVKGFQSLNQLQNPEQFQAWMKTIAMNRLRDVLKKNRPTLFSELSPEEEDTVIDFEDERVEHLPDVVVDRQETARLIAEILDTLTDEQRMAVVLYYYEEMSVKEIAEYLECSENTVKSRLNYARKKIKAQVEDLERRGTKLYGLAPLPFLLLLLRNAETYGPALSAPAATAASGAAGGAGTAAAQSAVGTAASGASGAASGAAAAAAGAAGSGVVTKIVAVSLAALLAIGGGVGAAKVISSRQNPSPAAVETMETASQMEEAEAERAEKEAKAETPSIEALYQEVLNEFVDAGKGENHARRNRDQYRYLNRDIFDSWILIDDEMYMADDFFYAEHDINGDGTPELLLGVLDHYYDADDEPGEYPISHYFDEYLYLTGAYGIQDSEVVDLFAQSGIYYEGYSTWFYLFDDGTLQEIWDQVIPDSYGRIYTQKDYRLSEDGDAFEELSSKNIQEDDHEGKTAKAKQRNILPGLDWKRVTEPIDAQAAAPTFQKVTDKEALKAFQPVLDEYEEINSDYETYEAISDQLQYVDGDSLYYNSSYFYPNNKLKYTLYDINGDGNKELIVAVNNCLGDALTYRYTPVSIYSYDGKAVENLYLDPFDVCMDDGYFYTQDDWDEDIITKLRLNSGGELEEVESWTFDWDSEQYRNDDSSFTREEWEKRVRDHDLFATLSWTDVESGMQADSAKEAYREYLSQCKENAENVDENYNPVYGDTLAEYAFFDLDRDGTKELIVKVGVSEATYYYRFLTYRNGKLVLLGVLDGGHSSLALDEDRNLIVQMCHQDHETDTKVTLKNGQLYGDVVYDKGTHEYKKFRNRPKEYGRTDSIDKIDLSEL